MLLAISCNLIIDNTYIPDLSCLCVCLLHLLPDLDTMLILCFSCLLKMFFQTVLYLILTAEISQAANTKFYTAAVYEHLTSYTKSNTGIVSRADALRQMEPHLLVLEEQVAIAKTQVR